MLEILLLWVIEKSVHLSSCLKRRDMVQHIHSGNYITFQRAAMWVCRRTATGLTSRFSGNMIPHGNNVQITQKRQFETFKNAPVITFKFLKVQDFFLQSSHVKFYAISCHLIHSDTTCKIKNNPGAALHSSGEGFLQ